MVEETEIGYRADCLSLDNTRPLRAILAIMVLINHLYTGPPRIGYLAVSGFMFLSGYGLMYGLNNKSGYLDSFFHRRIPALALPFIVVILVTSVLMAVAYGTYVDVWDLLAAAFVANKFYETTTIVGAYWFIAVLTIMYTAFYLAFKVSGGWKALTAITIFTIAISVFFYITSPEASWYYVSPIFFCAGLIMPNVRLNVLERLSRWYRYILMIVVLAFIISYILVCDPLNEIIMDIMVYVSAGTFVLFTILMLMKVDLRNPILSRLGLVSAEFFYFHGFFIVFSWDVLGLSGLLLSGIAAFTLTAVTALVTHYVSDYVVNSVRKVDGRGTVIIAAASCVWVFIVIVYAFAWRVAILL